VIQVLNKFPRSKIIFNLLQEVRFNPYISLQKTQDSESKSKEDEIKEEVSEIPMNSKENK